MCRDPQMDRTEPCHMQHSACARRARCVRIAESEACLVAWFSILKNNINEICDKSWWEWSCLAVRGVAKWHGVASQYQPTSGTAECVVSTGRNLSFPHSNFLVSGNCWTSFTHRTRHPVFVVSGPFYFDFSICTNMLVTWVTSFNNVTPRSRVIGKLAVVHLLRKFVAFYGTWSFTTGLNPEPDKSSPPPHTLFL